MIEYQLFQSFGYCILYHFMMSSEGLYAFSKGFCKAFSTGFCKAFSEAFCKAFSKAFCKAAEGPLLKTLDLIFLYFGLHTNLKL